VIRQRGEFGGRFRHHQDIGDSIVEWGVDVMTSGNHIWDKKEVLDYIPTEPRLLRPANYPAGVPVAAPTLPRAATAGPWA
jgi:calcineurin-like phosphoesterase